MITSLCRPKPGTIMRREERVGSKRERTRVGARRQQQKQHIGTDGGCRSGGPFIRWTGSQGLPAVAVCLPPCLSPTSLWDVNESIVMRHNNAPIDQDFDLVGPRNETLVTDEASDTSSGGGVGRWVEVRRRRCLEAASKIYKRAKGAYSRLLQVPPPKDGPQPTF